MPKLLFFIFLIHAFVVGAICDKLYTVGKNCDQLVSEFFKCLKWKRNRVKKKNNIVYIRSVDEKYHKLITLMGYESRVYREAEQGFQKPMI